MHSRCQLPDAQPLTELLAKIPPPPPTHIWDNLLPRTLACACTSVDMPGGPATHINQSTVQHQTALITPQGMGQPSPPPKPQPRAQLLPPSCCCLSPAATRMCCTSAAPARAPMKRSWSHPSSISHASCGYLGGGQRQQHRQAGRQAATDQPTSSGKGKEQKGWAARAIAKNGRLSVQFSMQMEVMAPRGPPALFWYVLGGWESLQLHMHWLQRPPHGL